MYVCAGHTGRRQHRAVCSKSCSLLLPVLVILRPWLTIDCMCGLNPTHTCPHLHTTRLQPPFFSTGLLHLGQGLVLMVIQFLVSLSPLIFSSHSSHILPAQRKHRDEVTHMPASMM